MGGKERFDSYTLVPLDEDSFGGLPAGKCIRPDLAEHGEIQNKTYATTPFVLIIPVKRKKDELY